MNPPREPHGPPTGPTTAHQLLAAAANAYGAGDLARAEQLCRQILRADRAFPPALNLLGIITARTGRQSEADELLGRAVAANPRDASAVHNHANLLLELGKAADALARFDALLALTPNAASAHAGRGSALHVLGRRAQALASYERALALMPNDARWHAQRAQLLHEMGDLPAALGGYERSIAIDARLTGVHVNRGIALEALGDDAGASKCYRTALELDPDATPARQRLAALLEKAGRVDEALSHYLHALAHRPGDADLHLRHGTLLYGLGRLTEALASFDAALRVDSTLAAAHNNRGLVLQDLGRLDAAITAYDAAITREPTLAAAHNNRGTALRALYRHREALDSYERALELDPDHADTHNNRGNVLVDLWRHAEAVASYDMALRLNPRFVDALVNRAAAQLASGDIAAAALDYARAFELAPTRDWLLGLLLHTRMKLAEWDGYEEHLGQLVRQVAAGARAAPPFAVITLTDDAAVQLAAARTWALARYPAQSVLPPPGPSTSRERVRIGYVSADFHEHATALLMAGLFEAHDRGRFEIIAICIGPTRRDPMRERLVAAFDEFVEVGERSDVEIAELCRRLELDVAVDLKGYTQHSRPGVFAHRAAPVQVGYLGYPGSSGAPYFDYFIADPIVAPDCVREHYTEQVVYLPHSFQVNDRTRTRGPQAPSRSDAGLPDAGFVFCCFNNSFKITPAGFALWMRILGATADSVLWLLADNEVAVKNLRRAAEQAGVDPRRLVFAARLPPAEHLARHAPADLFLDTVPCNAHTTASDALWAGLPVLTLPGRSFAARVAASLVTAAGLPELVATDAEHYVSLAIGAATNPGLVAGWKQRLERGRMIAPLFDTARTARHLERAYWIMHERSRAGLPPTPITIQDTSPV